MTTAVAYHPRLEYLLVALVALAVTFLTTPIARLVAVRIKAVAMPRNRDVHAVATPRMGGVAMFVGLAAGLFVATRLPALRSSFSTGPDFTWIVVGAALICLLGVIDDRWELDSLTKLCGQVLATGLMVTLGGVQLADIYLPGGLGTVSLGSDLSIPLTIGLTVLTINAINFIDGLDGLAAGVVAIASVAFFLYSFHLAQASFTELAAVPTLLSAVLGGACLGFLPHNFYPARVFMGDSGSMLVGLLLSAAYTTNANTDPQVFHDGLGSVPLSLPLLIPAAVLVIPFLDLVLAVIRRVRRRQSPWHPDKEHLHHRLLELGHSHRRAVLLLYLWAAVLSIGGVSLTLWRWQYVLVGVVLLALAATTLMSPAAATAAHAASVSGPVVRLPGWSLVPASVVVIAVAGSGAFGWGSGGRAALSFLGGFGLALAVTGFASVSVVILGRLSPAFSLLAAMTNYALTVLVFIVAVKTVDRSQVHVGAAACGLVASLVPYLIWQFRQARVRPLTEAERAAASGKSTLS